MPDQRIVDLGAGRNPDPRATETADVRPVADHQFDIEDTWSFGDNSVEGVIARHVYEHVTDREHFWSEAGRVLRRGGWLELTLPVGKNAVADDDHERVWQYTTPEHYCKHRQRSWDLTTDFVLDRRHLDVELQGFLAPLSPLLQVLATVSPGEAAYRCSAGELTARYCYVGAGHDES